jgi:hypothetical protein
MPVSFAILMTGVPILIVVSLYAMRLYGLHCNVDCMYYPIFVFV